MTTRALVLVLAWCVGPSAWAQPLADRVPADALVYVGWSGVDTMGAAYEQSHLKAVIDASEGAKLVHDVLPRLIAKLGQQDPDGAKALETVVRMAGSAWHRPTAFYFGGIDLSKPAAVPKLALLCEAGDDADALARQWNQLLADLPADVPVSIKAQRFGPVVAVYAGDLTANLPALHNLLGGKPIDAPSQPISASERFRGAMGRVLKSPSFVAYADVEGLLGVVDEAVAQQAAQLAEAGAPAPMGLMMWPKVRDGLGLGGLKRVVYASGFDGRDWAEQTFIEAPAPRVGLLKLFDAKPLSPAVYKAIPKTAGMAGGGRFDPAGTFTEVRNALAQVNPVFLAMFDGAVATASQTIGLDIQKDLLAPVGDEWAYYTDAYVGGQGVMGMVVVNRLRDPAAAEKAFAALGGSINRLIAAFTADEELSVTIKTTQYGGATIHYLAIPFVAPSWTVKDGNLYLALQPQVAAAAAGHVASGAPSFDQNEAFAALRKRMAAPAPAAFQYIDLPQLAPRGYETLLMLSRLMLGFADMAGIDAPAMALPPLSALRPHLAPAGGLTWTDDAGWHYRALSPFPGAVALGSQNNMMLSTQALAVGIMLPALGAARSTARQMTSATQLRGIHQAMFVFAQGNKDVYPKDIGILAVQGFFAPEFVVSPLSGRRPPPDYDAWPDKKKRDWINRNTSYVITVLGKKAESDANVVAGFGIPQDHGDIIPVVFDDGSVRNMSVDEAADLIQARTGKSLEKWVKEARPNDPE